RGCKLLDRTERDTSGSAGAGRAGLDDPHLAQALAVLAHSQAETGKVLVEDDGVGVARRPGEAGNGLGVQTHRLPLEFLGSSWEATWRPLVLPGATMDNRKLGRSAEKIRLVHRPASSCVSAGVLLWLMKRKQIW